MIHIIPISPGHFLIGKPLIQLSTIAYSNIQMSRLSRWQQQQQLQNYWKGGLLTISMSCTIANAGIAHPTTRPGDPEGGQHGSIPLDHSIHQ